MGTEQEREEAKRAYIALGTNLGDRWQLLRDAVARLAELGDVVRFSSVYETDPVGYLDQPAFLNMVVALSTTLSPLRLLIGMQAIEQDLGRIRTFRNAPRTIDLDLLLYGDAIIDEPTLTVPHPRMDERAFVLVPLVEIAAAEMHPKHGRTFEELAFELEDVSGVRRLSSLLSKTDA